MRQVGTYLIDVLAYVRLRSFNDDKVSFVIAKGQCAAHDPECNRVIQWGSALNSYIGTGYQPHFPDSAAQFTTHLDGLDGSRLMFLHLTQIYKRHTSPQCKMINLFQHTLKDILKFILFSVF